MSIYNLYLPEQHWAQFPVCLCGVPHEQQQQEEIAG